MTPTARPGASTATTATTATTTLYLARHGQSEWNHQRRITGQLDPGLAPRGREQAAAIAQCLAAEPLAAIYTSALQRTIATAQPTADAQRLNITALAAFNEIHLGVLQGRYRDERDPRAEALWAEWQADVWHRRVPGGERFDELAERACRALDAVLARHRGERVLVVGHRATNRALLGTLLQWPRARWEEIQLRNKYLYRLRLPADGSAPEIVTLVLSGSRTGTCQEGFVM